MKNKFFILFGWQYWVYLLGYLLYRLSVVAIAVLVAVGLGFLVFYL
jgi:hypothetical protein